VFRHNTRKLTILAGDLDFSPLVEALVLEGAYVTLMYERHSTAHELILAADAGEVLWPHIMFQNATTAFRTLHNLPSGISTRGVNHHQEEWANFGANWDIIWEEKCSTGRVTLFREKNGAMMLVWRAPDDENNYWLLNGSDEELLKKVGEDV
jgi:hypothetical protein